MVLLALFLPTIYLFGAIVTSHTPQRATAPTVTISKPTGVLRLKPPQAITTSLGLMQVNGAVMSCPQFFRASDIRDPPLYDVGELANASLFRNISLTGEDCLNMNIMRPSGTTAGADLPVIVWIFGGGFEIGSTTSYDATVVEASIALKLSVIFVAMNYRLGGFGFLPGSEVLKYDAANLGICDQRLALEWVADNIGEFGGDPSKVTIWGQSSGSISVFTQMAIYDGNITYNGSPLFRAAIMSSESIAPTSPVNGTKGQAVYNSIIREAGCDEANDTLECLRGFDYPTFLSAVSSVPPVFSYNSVALSYLPRPDGTVLTDSPENLVTREKYAPVPFIIGDQEDEGTIFALFQSNITIEKEVVDYLQDIFFFDASRDLLDSLVATYSNTTTDGSPFRTGTRNNLYPQYKRIAAIVGDFTFTLTRRVFLALASEARPEVSSWSYLSSYQYDTPIRGTFHGSDVLQIFYGGWPGYPSRAILNYFLSFVYDLDPNSRNGRDTAWSQWKINQALINFLTKSSSIITDDFRESSFDILMENKGLFHI